MTDHLGLRLKEQAESLGWDGVEVEPRDRPGPGGVRRYVVVTVDHSDRTESFWLPPEVAGDPDRSMRALEDETRRVRG